MMSGRGMLTTEFTAQVDNNEAGLEPILVGIDAGGNYIVHEQFEDGGDTFNRRGNNGEINSYTAEEFSAEHGAVEDMVTLTQYRSEMSGIQDLSGSLLGDAAKVLDIDVEINKASIPHLARGHDVTDQQESELNEISSQLTNINNRALIMSTRSNEVGADLVRHGMQNDGRPMLTTDLIDPVVTEITPEVPSVDANKSDYENVAVMKM